MHVTCVGKFGFKYSLPYMNVWASRLVTSVEAVVVAITTPPRVNTLVPWGTPEVVLPANSLWKRMSHIYIIVKLCIPRPKFLWATYHSKYEVWMVSSAHLHAAHFVAGVGTVVVPVAPPLDGDAEVPRGAHEPSLALALPGWWRVTLQFGNLWWPRCG